ncbi:hypothetical protein [Flavobacterium sp.]|uniref:hypothetical protein n=1 Tax=Flavobacterium sp. TaxID=239 RepID=UPI003750BEAD
MDKEIQDAFRQLKKRDVDTFIAKVVSVDKAKGTCTVNADGLDYFGVQLSAVVDDNQNNFYLFPKVKSWVLVSPINEDINRLYVESNSEIESLELVIKTVKFQIDKDGFLLKKENETLKALMVDLIDAIKVMSFATNVGPTISLINLPQFISIENRFKNFLK